ncbi:MAG TPA: retropepsin-like aspartic protease [Bacteroidia bacterium]|nr:retropepsin-like aspartic protease [Bacteroidia bacterium]
MAEKISLKILKIEGDGFHLQAKVKINGKPALVIVDTGASRTVFDRTEIGAFLKTEAIAEHDRVSTGLGTSSMQSQFVVLGSFSLGKIKMENFHAVILDLQHVNQTYAALGFKTIAGVLGSDVLMAHHAVIDFRKKSMTLTSPKIPKKKKVTKAASEGKKKTVRRAKKK